MYLFDIAGENAAAASQIAMSVTVGFISGSPYDFRLVHIAQADYATPQGSALTVANDKIIKHAYQAVATTVVGSLSGHDPDSNGVILASDVSGPTLASPNDPGDTLVFDVTSFVQADELDALSLSLFRLEVADPTLSPNGAGIGDNFQFWAGNGGSNAAAEAKGLGMEVLPQLNFVPEPTSLCMVAMAGILSLCLRRVS